MLLILVLLFHFIFIFRLGNPIKKVEEVGEGRVDVTFFVIFGLVDFADILDLKDIKRRVRSAGGKIEPIPTLKPFYKHASDPYFLPQIVSSDYDE